MADMLRPLPIDLEPKRKNRFVLEFPADLGFAEWMVQSGARPSMSLDEIEIPYMNTKTYIPGQGAWETMEVTFIDPIGPSATQKVMDWIRQCIEFATGKMGYVSQYKKNLVLKLLDPTGETVEKWRLEGAWIMSANFNELDHGSADLANINCTLRYDRAILEF